MSQSQQVLELMQRVAAEVITPRFRSLADEQVHQKRPGDYVTDADREAEVQLTAELRRMFPDAHVVGEEACFADPQREFGLGSAAHAFTVDPIDGTRNFVNGSPDHAVMIAEVRDGRQVAAWIWQPEHRAAYVAELGAGTWLLRPGHEDQRITRGSVQRPPVGATSKHRRHGFDGGGVLAPVGSSRWCCGVDYPRLLTGEVDYLVYSNVHPWDHLPGTLLVREAGGVARRFDGQDYTPEWTGPGLMSAATPEVWDRVRGVWGEPD